MARKTRMLKVGAATVAGLALAGIGYLYGALPAVPPASPVTVKRTTELEARGVYLAEHVALCVDCHSERDFGRLSGPVKPGTFGRGGERFGRDMGFPGELYASNITPAAIGAWTDGELIRALTTGVSRDERPLFPLMPYPAFAQLCDRDLEAIVTYVRNLAPVPHEVPKSQLDFPVNLIVRTLPKPRPAAPPCPDGRDTVALGEYLVRTASCIDCHSQRERGEFVPGMEFAGGAPFPLPTGGVVRSANITPHVETGLGAWSREDFVRRFKALAQTDALPEVTPGGFNTVMPWSLYAGMTEADLGAIYDYLRTLPPVANPVSRFDQRVAAATP